MIDRFKQSCFTWSLSCASLLGLLVTPVKSQEIFGEEGIKFAVDTIVEFEFVESHGAYQSTFGVINLQTGQKSEIFKEIKGSDNEQALEVPSDYVDDSGRNADFAGTPGNTVPYPKTEFYFQANTPYAFYLQSSINGRDAGTLYSVESLNPTNNQQARFRGSFVNLSNGGVIIRWDDTGSKLVRRDREDTDFDDFIVIMGGGQPCALESNNVCPVTK